MMMMKSRYCLIRRRRYCSRFFLVGSGLICFILVGIQFKNMIEITTTTTTTTRHHSEEETASSTFIINDMDQISILPSSIRTRNATTTTTNTTKIVDGDHHHPLRQRRQTTFHQKKIKIIEEIVIDKIWSAAHADFCFLTHHKSKNQYVAYYNSNRQIVIGMRKLIIGSQTPNYNDNDNDDNNGNSNKNKNKNKNKNNDGRNINFFDKYILPSPMSNNQPPFKGNSTISPSSSTIQGWDSHNYLTLAVDQDGYLHFAGNMHATPLLYYRMEELDNISSMKHFPIMINEKTEIKSTYPNFIIIMNNTQQRPEGEGELLLFHYRFGGIGNGKEFYNIYNTQTKQWSRFQETPLFGSKTINTRKNNKKYSATTTTTTTTSSNNNITKSKNSAYQAGPYLGPDGWYHLLWMWRSSPDASTCHDISYAKSQNLKHWVTAEGNSLELPITFENSQDAIIDPVPKHGGLLNTVHHIGFDSKHRPIVSYHKNDKNGNTQACVARYYHFSNRSSSNGPNDVGGSSSSWNVSIISDWKYHHAFDGTGSLGRSSNNKSDNISWINLGIVHDNEVAVGELALPFQHWKHGHGLLIFDEETLQPIRVVPVIPSRYPNKLYLVESTFPGMMVRWLDDNPFRQHHQEIDPPPPPLLPETRRSTYYHALRWESLGRNRDEPRAKPWPPNSSLVLYTFELQEQAQSLS